MTIPRDLSNLAPGVSTAGVLGVTKGGTGLATITANNVILGNGTSALQAVAPGTNGNVLTSNGTTWTSAAPAAQAYPGAGIANSTGTAWGTSYTTSGSGTVVALITNPVFIGTKETRVAIPASDIDLSTGNYFTRTISGTTTLTVSNVPTTGTAASFILDLTNGGSATVNFFANVKWAGGTAPTLTAAGRDALGFYTYDGGTTWTGLVLGLDIK